MSEGTKAVASVSASWAPEAMPIVDGSAIGIAQYALQKRAGKAERRAAEQRCHRARHLAVPEQYAVELARNVSWPGQGHARLQQRHEQSGGEGGEPRPRRTGSRR